MLIRIALVTFFLASGINILFARPAPKPLSLPSPSNKIEITMPARNLRQLHEVREKRDIMKKAEMTINGKAAAPVSIRIRGQSSLGFQRKSLNIKLQDKAVFLNGEQTYAMKEFYLIGMTMDQYYYRSYLSYSCLKYMGLFPMFFAYTEVYINGETQGVYMVVEKPHECMKKQDAPCVIRRGYSHKIEEVKYMAKKTNLPERAFTEAYDLVYQLPEKYSGKELYNAWNEYLDVDAYMRWLAFNFFIMNGDYADEVYLYALPGKDSVRFGIIPWDYDDILVGNPQRKDLFIFHKGWHNKYMYMAEEKIDQIIAGDKWLHRHYLEILQEVMDEFPPEKMQEIFDSVVAELSPFYLSAETISMSRYDEDGAIKSADFPQEMKASLDYLIARREWLLTHLKNE
ncbi:MAG: CotH kinase family protein [Bacteroidia bacterium]